MRPEINLVYQRLTAIRDTLEAISYEADEMAYKLEDHLDRLLADDTVSSSEMGYRLAKVEGKLLQAKFGIKGVGDKANRARQVLWQLDSALDDVDRLQLEDKEEAKT